ncbi:protein LTV1 homolog isoform X2 [Neoarius graeffei]|uniref:protein LTV1 homolog isoform X2 n=1 Tax=Neoarius graeffei TaxID=443677 RepID=UPI00298D34FD|nr:protein LTV1 homolog isoform X2 [Neoarius graeffei]
MPHRKKKSFIDKKNAVSFHLVHRSQKDPLAADEKAPQHVLLPASKIEVEKRREEQRKYGVFFDDDYDYLQHLREASQPAELVSASRPYSNSRPLGFDEEEEMDEDEQGKEEEVLMLPAASIKLPSSVFASEFEEEVGLLNKAAPVSGPRLDMDPDIVAALDEDFDFDNPENILEDDFVIKANDVVSGGGDVGEGDDDEEWEDTDEGDDDDDEQSYDSAGGVSDEDGEADVRRFMFMDCETKSRFTDYSLTSSVMRRNEQLTLLDDRFEKFYEQFDDDEIGALDHAELEGFIDPSSTRLEEIIHDYFKEKAKAVQTPEQLGRPELPSLKDEDDEEKDEEEQEMETLVIEEPPEEKWDCETIISTYSNLYNHPKLIEEPRKKPIRVSNKTGIPLDVLPTRGLTARQVERMERINDSDLPRVSTQPRSREESKEDRKLRKQAIKEERKERRLEKKANKVAFKQEKQKQEKQMVSLRANVQGMTLS